MEHIVIVYLIFGMLCTICFLDDIIDNNIEMLLLALKEWGNFVFIPILLCVIALPIPTLIDMVESLLNCFNKR